jgi:hypothetical protein
MAHQSLSLFPKTFFETGRPQRVVFGTQLEKYLYIYNILSIIFFMKWTAFGSIRRFSKPGSLNIRNNAFSEDAANSDLTLTLPNGFSMVKQIYLSDNIYLFLFPPPCAKCRQQNIIVIIFNNSW